MHIRNCVVCASAAKLQPHRRILALGLTGRFSRLIPVSYQPLFREPGYQVSSICGLFMRPNLYKCLISFAYKPGEQYIIPNALSDLASRAEDEFNALLLKVLLIKMGPDFRHRIVGAYNQIYYNPPAKYKVLANSKTKRDWQKITNSFAPLPLQYFNAPGRILAGKERLKKLNAFLRS